MRIILLARKNQLMRFVNLRKKIIVQLVTAEVNYLATLYYQATKASSVEFCSAQTVPTSPGDKKSDTAVPGDKNCSYQLQLGRMIQKVPAKVLLFASFQGYDFNHQQVEVSYTQIKRFHAFNFFSWPALLLAQLQLVGQRFYLSFIDCKSSLDFLKLL